MFILLKAPGCRTGGSSVCYPASSQQRSPQEKRAQRLKPCAHHLPHPCSPDTLRVSEAGGP